MNQTATEQQVTVQAPRLPMPMDSVCKDLDITPALWATLVDAVFPSAKSTEGVQLAISYCRHRNLDPLKRPVHVVPVWSSAKGRMVEGVWPGINETRTTAMRTNSYAGCDDAVLGKDMTNTFAGNVKITQDNKPDKWQKQSVTVIFPAWCQITVYKLMQGHRVPFVGPKVYWLETYAKLNNFVDLPNSKWQKSPRYMLEKCAEAAALRRAFPEECGELTAEEMEGKIIDADVVEHAPGEARPKREDFEKPKAAPAPEAEDVYALLNEFGESVGTFGRSEFTSRMVDNLQRLAKNERALFDAYWEFNEGEVANLGPDKDRQHITSVWNAERANVEARDDKSNGKLPLVDVEGVVVDCRTGGEWLNAFEKSFDAAKGKDEKAKIWEANADTFNHISNFAKNPQSQERLKEVSDKVFALTRD